MAGTPKKMALGRGLEALFGDINTAVPAAPPSKTYSGKANTGKSAVETSTGKAGSGKTNAGKAVAGNANTGKTRNVRPQSVSQNSAFSENGILYIDIDEIKPNAMQPRRHFNEESVDGLAESIRQHGVIQPVMLRESSIGYELVAGERRWRAARKAGLRQIPAIIRDLNAEENALFAIIENVQREDLNPMEEAVAFRRIMDEYGMTQENISKSVGRSRPYIANTLRLLKLPREIRVLIENADLTLGHANALGAIKEEAKQKDAAKQIVRDGMSVREAELLAAKLSGRANDKTEKAKPRAKRKNPEIRRLEEDLTGLLGTKVTIGGSEKSGAIEIHYYSKDELEGLLEEFQRMKDRNI